ncbi:MAG: patatin-like phospholipase family protein [Clostridia bacterium]|nr:patatin-like phospholipase family protein [Clostridia bacterium]
MKIGLVLAGALVKGAYYVGALRALEEFIPPENITCVSTASVGTISAQAFFTHKLDRGEKMWYDLCNGDKKTFLTQLLPKKEIQDCINELTATPDPLDRPFYTSLLNSSQMTLCYDNLAGMTAEERALRTRASIAFPIYSEPVIIDNNRYLDGGFVDNIPVHPLVDHDLDYIICFYFDAVAHKFEDHEFDNKVIKITYPNMGKIRESLILSRDNVDRMIEEGYNQTKETLSKVFVNGYNDMETISRYIAEQNENENAKWRFTADLVISNINRLTRQFAKRKKI